MVNSYKLMLNSEQVPYLIKEREIDKDNEQLDTPCKVAKMLDNCFNTNIQAEEHIYMICFNHSMNPIGVFEVGHGLADCCQIRPREILIRALLCGATGIILVHNHPSGNLNPSDADKQACLRLKEACDLVGVAMHDSMIVGGSGYYSFKKQQICF